MILMVIFFKNRNIEGMYTCIKFILHELYITWIFKIQTLLKKAHFLKNQITFKYQTISRIEYFLKNIYIYNRIYLG